jgi:hypothetical protein
MMETTPGQLNLGSFNITLPEKWDAQFFPSIETKLRLVKADSIVIIEHYLVPHAEAERFLDEFYDDHILDLQRSVNGVIFFDEQDTDYEILAENSGAFCRYFFHAEGSFLFRFTLSGSWEPTDEDEVRAMLSSLTLNGDVTESTGEISLATFEIDFQNWFHVGAMYSKIAGS